jgi:hypothetical protein
MGSTEDRVACVWNKTKYPLFDMPIVSDKAEAISG